MSELHQRDACGGAVVASHATTAARPARMPTCKGRLQVHRVFDVAYRATELERAETEHEEELAKIMDAKAIGRKI